MRRIEKDVNCIPRSLKVDSQNRLYNPAKTTHERLLQIISDGMYPKPSNSSLYDARYKMADIKDLLGTKYMGKCAYCETPVEQMVVEHYRPKRGGYYWLAYSWDNLLLACPTCNVNKGDDFPISRDRVAYDPNRDTIEQIHQLGPLYDKMEGPLVVNPERALPSEISSIWFDKEGRIYSNNDRMNQTIETCKLRRKSLCDRRKKIWDDFLKEINLAVVFAGDNKAFLQIRLDQVVKAFAIKCNDSTQDYTAFRQFVLYKSAWISQSIKELLCY